VSVLKGHFGTVDSVSDVSLYVNWDIDKPAWNASRLRNIVEKAAVLPGQVEVVLKENSTGRQQKAEAALLSSGHRYSIQAAEIPQHLQGSDHRYSQQAASDEAPRDPAEGSQQAAVTVLEQPQRIENGTGATADTLKNPEKTPEEKTEPSTNEDAAHKAGQADSAEATCPTNSSAKSAPSTNQDDNKAGTHDSVGTKPPSSPPPENGEKSARKEKGICCC